MKIIDRYVIRQVVMPFGIGLLVFTFLIMLRPLQEYAEALVAKNVPAQVVAWLLLMLAPQALALTIPMALLLGLLVGFGRLSADREFVAMQACGIGLKRLLLPGRHRVVPGARGHGVHVVLRLPQRQRRSFSR